MENRIVRLEKWSGRYKNLTTLVAAVAAVLALAGYTFRDFLAEIVKGLPTFLQQLGSLINFLIGQNWFWFLVGLTLGCVIGILTARLPPKSARRRMVASAFEEETEIQGLGIEITNLRSGQAIVTWDKGGVYEVMGTYKIRPGANVFAFTCRGGNWWPQPHPFSVDETRKTWRTKMHFGASGPFMLYIVRANELGVALINYYWKVGEENRHRKAMLKGRNISDESLQGLPGEYPGIEMLSLPQGLCVEAMVDVVVAEPPRVQGKAA
jgi:hypothetical protein